MNDRPTKKVKAWLVTWEWCGDHAKQDDKVVAVFNPRLGDNHIRDLVEFLYMTHCYTISERLAYSLHPKSNPYRAHFGELDGMPWGGEIICGHNPYLRARLVDDLTIERNDDGKEEVNWKERPKPDVQWMRA
ncbi:MAG: hypothetical protein ABSA48_00790 [Terracidiphilus sp.]|jgi:hypothetical protein